MNTRTNKGKTKLMVFDTEKDYTYSKNNNEWCTLDDVKSSQVPRQKSRQKWKKQEANMYD